MKWIKWWASPGRLSKGSKSWHDRFFLWLLLSCCICFTIYPSENIWTCWPVADASNLLHRHFFSQCTCEKYYFHATMFAWVAKSVDCLVLWLLRQSNQPQTLFTFSSKYDYICISGDEGCGKKKQQLVAQVHSQCSVPRLHLFLGYG